MFPYLYNFAKTVKTNSSTLLDVSKLTKSNTMLQILNDTVLVYAWSRSNHFLTNVPNEPMKGNDQTVEIVSLEQELVKAVSVLLNNKLS